MRFRAAWPTADVQAGVQDPVDSGLRKPEQQRVGPTEQRVVVVVGTAPRELTGHHEAVAALVERMHCLALGPRVERVQPDTLMQQHIVMIEARRHDRVNLRYSGDKSGPSFFSARWS
jgi:hypothetical protein